MTIVAHDVGSVGGMERQLAELALGLRGLGHEVTVIARTCELPAGSGVIFHRIYLPRRPFLIAYLWFMIAGSLTLRRRRRGVVQVAGAIVLNRVDTIAVHCCHQVYRSPPSSPNPLLRGYVQTLGVVKRVFERVCFGANRSAKFVCVSDGVAQEVRDHFPQLAGKVLTIHNGVDTGAFAPGVRGEQARALRAELQIAPGRLVAAFVGGNWEHKGLAQLIRALAQAPDWDLVVAGPGNVRRYQELADRHRVGEAVHWLGVVRDIQRVYGLADAFVLPSGYETFSLVTFEAAASGLAILATPVSGVRELIEDGHTGLLISQEPSAIAEGLQRLAEDPALRRQLGDAAREAALKFSWQEMVAKHHELFLRLDGEP
ncbi:MAG: glycosyltransferase family 4 protein [Actinomycetota bacterium]|nr:glycosyltransferase family 4 protein [Actinomycetota bacterium]